MSTTKSTREPDERGDVLAPATGGTSAKWMPRTVPRDDTETLVCTISQPVAEALGELVAAERLEEDAAVVRELARGDLVGAGDRQRADLHQRVPSLLGEQAVQVDAVAALGQVVGQAGEAVVVEPAVAPGDLLDAADLLALPLLDDVDELRWRPSAPRTCRCRTTPCRGAAR